MGSVRKIIEGGMWDERMSVYFSLEEIATQENKYKIHSLMRTD